jgi:hypothetical protein
MYRLLCCVGFTYCRWGKAKVAIAQFHLRASPFYAVSFSPLDRKIRRKVNVVGKKIALAPFQCRFSGDKHNLETEIKV